VAAPTASLKWGVLRADLAARQQLAVVFARDRGFALLLPSSPTASPVPRPQPN